MNSTKIVFKFERVDAQENGSITRIVGLAKARSIVDLISVGDLRADPREARVGKVTNEILETLEKSPEIFPFKSKGILLASSNFKKLERNRYELSFERDEVEGILDGGHNTLAIALHALQQSEEFGPKVKLIKRWGDVEKVWPKEEHKQKRLGSNLDFLVPLEVIVPTTQNDENELISFRNSIAEISHARNNNVELKVSTMSNQKGFYDHLKSSMDSKIKDEVEWKTNDDGRIKSELIVALAWIPLLRLNLEALPRVSPVQLYSSKGKCTAVFADFMEHDNVTSHSPNDYKRELSNPLVGSAFEMLAQLPALYDQIYESFPSAYNSTGGKFGRITCVKMFDGIEKYTENPSTYLKQPPKTRIYRRDAVYQYPDGFIMPLVAGLGAIMHIENEKLVWATEPTTFLDNNLNDILKSYKLMMDMANYDPQKVGKSLPSYELTRDLFANRLG
ncbi:MAG: hypothetical protein HOK33_03570 [Rhodobiaceae bacterium]|nr:hypothetical protein [Rhodobiaceae bacterium]